MISGMESFREHFQGYEDCYTIIGGAACDILMHDAALNFRATKDIDMILLIENRFEAFAELVWSYIKAGGYRCGWKKLRETAFLPLHRVAEEQFPRDDRVVFTAAGFSNRTVRCSSYTFAGLR